MSQTLIAPQTHKTQVDLALIVANASFLWERLDAQQFVVNSKSGDELKINQRCERWCQTVGLGNQNTLQKRLQWQGTNLAQIRPYLGNVQFRANQPLPDWALTLEQIIQTATQFVPEAEVLSPINPEKPFPFEDVLLPIVRVARHKLLARLGTVQLSDDALPLAILTESAYQTLEISLLKQLGTLSAKTLDFEFSKVNTFGRNLLNSMGLAEKSSPSKTRYTEFVNELLQDGLATWFEHYPVLGRLIATTIEYWVNTTAEFLQRLDRDRASIQQTFASLNSAELGKVTEIQCSLSDAHNGGKTVILLIFASGLKLVYKPKNLELEAAFNQFLEWCNQHSQLLEFKVIQVLNRQDYGWVEYVEHLPCADEAAADRFYQRAGMLLCVLYALRGTDCHRENLIASGEHLVLIDMETLLHPDANLMDDSSLFEEVDTAASQHYLNSVLRIGMLPNWSLSANRRIAYDMSGLGSVNAQQAPQKSPRWQDINTDSMHIRYESLSFEVQKNTVYVGDRALSPNDYQAQITAGFEQMYRFLMANKDELLRADGLLTTLYDQQVRFIFRATQVYATLQFMTWTPDVLRNGADYSIELEHLSRPFMLTQNKPNAWEIFNAELRSMQQLDIPFFTVSTMSDALQLNDALSISKYFRQPSYQDLLNQIQALNENDLAQQVAIIEGSLDARVAAPPSQEQKQWNIEAPLSLSSEQWIEQAKAIATRLEARAFSDPNGSVNWIGLTYLVEANRYQFQVLEDGLYDGRCGVALFLAALYQATQEERFRELALRSLHALRRQIQTYSPEAQQRLVRLLGISGTKGVGSMVYTLVKVSQFLNEPALLQDAEALAEWITVELIIADQLLDIVSGAAGTLLAFLALYEATGNPIALAKAIACGEQLLSQRCSYESAPRAWQSIEERPLTGFSHGAAGIAYALLRLYAVTQNSDYRDAASEGIEYERSVFSPANANWPDYRFTGRTGQPAFRTHWCHGTAGIGIARLGGLPMLATEQIYQDIEVALTQTPRQSDNQVDHVCCGNAGQVEVFLLAAKRLDRPELQAIAQQKAAWFVARAEQMGGYRLVGNLPNCVPSPGFFQGLSGIGYQLLRLAAPETVPSVLLWE